jgi:hypothetical protein
MTRRALSTVLGLGVATALLTGCSAPTSEPDAADTEATSTPTSVATDVASVDASDAPVNQLPLLDGVSDGTPAGWLTGECGGLTFSYPADWWGYAPGQPKYNGVIAPSDISSTSYVAADGTPTTVSTAMDFTCLMDKSDWDGSWSGDGAESYSLDVPGSRFAGMWVKPQLTNMDAGDGTAIPNPLMQGEIQLMSKEGVYYSAAFTFPPGEAGYGFLRGFAGGLSFE